MKHIYYFFTIAALMWEAGTVFEPQRVHKFLTNFRLNARGKKWDDYTSTQQSYTICAMGYMCWQFVGLFTFQWPVFLGYLLMGFIPKRHIVLRWVDAAVSIVVLLFVVLNSYHLKIDVWKLIQQYL